MSDRHARGVERAIQEAEKRGEFANLPGAGKPLNLEDNLSENWWLRQKSTRENIGLDALPPTLRIRHEIDNLETKLDSFKSESKVRDYLEELNKRIRDALLVPGDGPPLRTGLVDVEAELKAWRQRR